MGSLLLPCAPPGIPDRERGPDRCHASGAAVNVCSDAPAWAQRADRVADGGVVYEQLQGNLSRKDFVPIVKSSRSCALVNFCSSFFLETPQCGRSNSTFLMRPSL